METYWSEGSGSLRKQVYETLENAILNGEYQPGESLSELKLSKSLGVSRTPVREALMQLEQEGLVENIPNKGAQVVGISQEDVEDIYAIRIRIEGLAARLCAEHMPEEEVVELQRTVELQEFYLSKADIPALEKLDNAFHKMMYHGSGSHPLQHVLTNFHHYIQWARFTSFGINGRSQKSVAEHRAILEAIQRRDPDAAEEAARVHIEHAKDNLLRDFDQKMTGQP